MASSIVVCTANLNVLAGGVGNGEVLGANGIGHDQRLLHRVKNLLALIKARQNVSVKAGDAQLIGTGGQHLVGWRLGGILDTVLDLDQFRRAAVAIADVRHERDIACRNRLSFEDDFAGKLYRLGGAGTADRHERNNT